MRTEHRDPRGPAARAPEPVDARAVAAAGVAPPAPLGAGPLGAVTLRARLALLRPRPIKVRLARMRES